MQLHQSRLTPFAKNSSASTGTSHGFGTSSAPSLFAPTSLAFGQQMPTPASILAGGDNDGGDDDGGEGAEEVCFFRF